MDWFVKAVEAAKSLPVSLFIGLAAIGLAALYLPAFGGADLTVIHNNGWLAWLMAVSGTILALSKGIGLILSARLVEAQRRKARLWKTSTNRYTMVYAPIVARLTRIHIIMNKPTGPKGLRQRLEAAREEFEQYRWKRVAIRQAWLVLVGKPDADVLGEVYFGEVFPIDFIEHTINMFAGYCDTRLLTLKRNALKARIIDHVDPWMLSKHDCILFDHIQLEHARLKQFLGR